MPDALPDRLSATATQPASSSNMAAKIVNNFTLIEGSKGFFSKTGEKNAEDILPVLSSVGFHSQLC